MSNVEKDILRQIKIKEIDLDSCLKRLDFFKSSYITEDIISLYLKINTNAKYKDIIESYKKQMLEYTKEMSSTLNKFEYNMNIKKSDIEKVVESFLREKNMENLIKRIADYFKIINKEVEDLSKDSIPVSLGFVSIKNITNKGYSNGIDDAQEYWYMTNYGIRQGISFQIMIEVFNRLLETKKLTKQKLIKYFSGKSFFITTSNLRKFLIGLDRYFKGDFLSAMSIWVPLFENTFILLSERMGLDIVSISTKNKGVGTKDKIFGSDLLNSDKFIEKRGINFIKQIDFCFFNELGYTIRHRLAHGDMKIEEFNLMNSNLILYFFMTLGTYIK